MQITVNDEKIDFTLENETNLFEVLESLRSWLEGEGFVMTEAKTDGRDLGRLTEGELRKTDVGAVESLHIAVESVVEREYRDLQAVDEYFRLLKAALSSGRPDIVRRLTQEYPHLLNGLDPLLARNGIASAEIAASTLDTLVAGSGLLESASVEGDRREQFFSFIDRLRAAVAARTAELADPVSALATAAGELRRSIDQLNDVSIMLQTGRDQEAMEAIVRFAELSGRIVRQYPLLKHGGGVDFAGLVVDGTSFPDFYADFNRVLSELIDAFGAEDSILIGDLLEYEVAPRLEHLRAYIDLMTGA